MSHNGFEISLSVPLPDFEAWGAKVVNLEGFENRAVLIQGPSGGYFLRDGEMVDKYTDSLQNEKTKEQVNTHFEET